MAQALPSWRPGAIRDAILEFVEAVSTPGGGSFVPATARIAVFDNDGTLWCEQPAQPQVMFAQARLEQLAKANPSLRSRQPYKAFLEHDAAAMNAMGKEGVFEVAFAAHAGMTVDAFEKVASDWLNRAEHPKFKRSFMDLIYQPQLELMAYLREHGFETWIVSGGGADFIRAYAEESYGVSRSKVIGSTVRTQVKEVGPRVELLKLAQLDSFDDSEVKVENIGSRIGRRPILAFGNSDGDLAMLRYTLSGPGRRLALLLHHDDDAREVAYDRGFRLSPLAEALDNADAYGIRVVSMTRDWAEVFQQKARDRPGAAGASAVKVRDALAGESTPVGES